MEQPQPLNEWDVLRKADKQALLKTVYNTEWRNSQPEELMKCLRGLAFLVNSGEEFSEDEYSTLLFGIGKTLVCTSLTKDCVIVALSILTLIVKKVDASFMLETALVNLKHRFPDCVPAIIRLQSMIVGTEAPSFSSLYSQAMSSNPQVASSAMFGIGYLIANGRLDPNDINPKELLKIIDKRKDWNYSIIYIIDALLEPCMSSGDLNKMGKIIASILPNETSIQKNWDINPFLIQRIIECISIAAEKKPTVAGSIFKLPKNLSDLLYTGLTIRPRVLSSSSSRYILPTLRYVVLRYILINRNISISQKNVIDALPDALNDMQATAPGRLALADILSDAMTTVTAPGQSNALLSQQETLNSTVSNILLQVLKVLVHDFHPQTACLALNALISASALRPQSTITETSEMKNARIVARDTLFDALHSDDVCRRVSTMSQSMRRRMLDACNYMVEECISSGSFSITDNTLNDIIGIIDIMLDSDTSTLDASASTQSITSRSFHQVESQNALNTRRCLDVLMTIVKVYIRILTGLFTSGNIPPSLSNIAAIISHISRIVYRSIEDCCGNELNRLSMYLRDLAIETGSLTSVLNDLDPKILANPEVVHLYNSLMYPISCLVRSTALSTGSFYGSPFTIAIETLPKLKIFEDIFGNRPAGPLKDEIVDFDALVDLFENNEDVSSIDIPHCDVSDIVVNNPGSNTLGQKSVKNNQPEVCVDSPSLSVVDYNRTLRDDLLHPSEFPAKFAAKLDAPEEYQTTGEEIPLNEDADSNNEDVIIKHKYHWRKCDEGLLVVIETVLVHSVDAELTCRLEYKMADRKAQSTVATLAVGEVGHVFTDVGVVPINGLNVECSFLYKNGDWVGMPIGEMRIGISSFMRESQFLQCNKEYDVHKTSTEFILDSIEDRGVAAKSIASILRLGIMATSVDNEDVLTCVLGGLYTPTGDALFVTLKLTAQEKTAAKKGKKPTTRHFVKVLMECKSTDGKLCDLAVDEIAGRE